MYGALPDGCNRRHPCCAQGRREPSEQRDQRPDEQRDDDRASGEDRLRLRQVEVQCDEELIQSDCEPEPGEQSDDRRDQADQQCLQDHGGQHLPARRADRSQRGELARPLRNRDRERVEDHEGADEQGDTRERQQEVADDRRERRDLAGLLARLLGTGPHRHCRPQIPPDAGDELLGCDPLLRGGLHRVELALLLQERLRGRDVEDRERGAAERAQIAVPRDSDDLELPGGAEGRDADPVADGETLLVGNPLVDRELPRARRPAALDEVERIEAVVLGCGLDPKRERGRPSRVNRLAI